MTLGYAELADLGIVEYGGQTFDGGAILIRYTYDGDANLDGLIDAQDYGIIDNWVQFPGTTGYWRGDFNYDDVIDAVDYGIIDNTIQLQGPPLILSAGAGAVVAVPESGIGAAGIIGAIGLATRRFRRSRSAARR
jgi:hypothetical protein